MHWFLYKEGELYAEDVRLSDAAGRFGTPLFVYSKATLVRHIQSIDSAFNSMDHLTCYSVKANSNLSLLRLFAEHGLGADIVSGGELFRARKAGIPGCRIVYSGVGKREDEIRYALESDILMFNVESESELKTINRIAGEMRTRAPVAFRINPDVDPKTHPYISTGLMSNKFGIPHAEALRIYREAAVMPNVRVVGIDAHIGSQLIDISPFREAAKRMVELVEEIRRTGVTLKIIDIGGGLGIKYNDEIPPDPSSWAEMIQPYITRTGCRLIIEPGRSMVGNACVLVTKVLYIKKNLDKIFIVIDAGMNDITRPTLYGSYHAIIPAVKRGTGTLVADIVGPICESGDFIAKNREIQEVQEGDYLAVMSAGAYGISMSSNYNSRLRAAEVLVEGDTTRLITKRETYDDLVSREL